MNVPDGVVLAVGGGWVTWVSGTLILLLRKVTRVETLLRNGRGRHR